MLSEKTPDASSGVYVPGRSAGIAVDIRRMKNDINASVPYIMHG